MELDKKSKKEQIFLLLIICVAFFGILCISGCDEDACVKFGSEDLNNGSAVGVSIPGCGSCGDCLLCSGCICGTTSCKFISANEDGFNLIACDQQYKSTDCGGCQSKRSCYNGFVSIDDGYSGETGNIDKGFGLFYGDDSKSQNERIIGCADGCFYCESTGDAMIDILATLEEYLDI